MAVSARAVYQVREREFDRVLTAAEEYIWERYHVRLKLKATSGHWRTADGGHEGFMEGMAVDKGWEQRVADWLKVPDGGRWPNRTLQAELPDGGHVFCKLSVDDEGNVCVELASSGEVTGVFLREELPRKRQPLSADARRVLGLLRESPGNGWWSRQELGAVLGLDHGALEAIAFGGGELERYGIRLEHVRAGDLTGPHFMEGRTPSPDDTVVRLP